MYRKALRIKVKAYLEKPCEKLVLGRLHRAYLGARIQPNSQIPGTRPAPAAQKALVGRAPASRQAGDSPGP